jgi:hypothetical protein
MSRPLIAVSAADRDFLLHNIQKLTHVEATDRATRLALVEKRWHDSLIAWLKLPAFPYPGPICTSSLLDHDKPSLSIVQGKDFIVVDYSLWDDLIRIFGKARPVVRHYVLHSATKQPTVLLDPISLQIDFEGRPRHKSVARDWKIGDVRRQLCFVLSIPVDDYRLYCSGMRLSDALPVNTALSTSWALKKQVSLFPEAPAPIRDVGKAVKHVGLRNLGNTCFFNSAVQCLLRVPPLLDFVLSPSFSGRVSCANPEGSGGRIAGAFRELAETVSMESGYSVSPQRLHSEVCRKYRVFGDYGQHDSQELLGALLDGLHEDLNQSFVAKGTQGQRDLPKKCRSVGCSSFKALIGDRGTFSRRAGEFD